MYLGCYQWTVQQDIGLISLVSPLLFSTYKEVCPILSPASPGTGLVIYKPLQDVTAFEGDTNVQFSIVPSDFNASLVFVDCRITSAPPGSSLQSTPPFPSHCKGCLVISGPVSLVDSGTVVTCDVFRRANWISYTATLTVLGE